MTLTITAGSNSADLGKIGSAKSRLGAIRIGRKAEVDPTA